MTPGYRRPLMSGITDIRAGWLVAAVAALLAGCADPGTPDAQVRAMISAAETAVTQRDLGESPWLTCIVAQF